MLLFLLQSIISLATTGRGVLNHCREKERKALLLFKQGIHSDSGLLSTWTNQEDEDCCNWKGVYCSKETGHVQILDLHGSFYSSSVYLKGKINITSLIELHDLQHLDLSYNDFYLSDILESIESFTNLKYLNLSYSSFVGSIPYQLGKLSHLLSLDLSYNNLDRAIPWQIGNLSKLQYLNLEQNYLVGAIPSQLGNLTKLHTLKLGSSYDDLTAIADGNNLNTECLSSNDFAFTSFINPNLTFLLHLDLSFNHLTSSTIFYWLSNFTFNLHVLYLDDNLLRGSIPNSFGNIISSLEVLDLSNNKLRGEIPTSLGNICTLEYLELSYNNLSGGFSNFTSNASWCNGHSLQQLLLSRNQLTSMSPNLSVFSSLQYLDLSDNNLKGKIVESHFKNLSNLMSLSLSRNSLTLEISSSWAPPFQLRSLDMASCVNGFGQNWTM
ncbi:receptor-like protein EIX1 [Prosopis cineraria]|uniref:receptor-like protein EIX1 n=1 Tax=Prosopis cineraria TaxID=364024 RepID=UPI00241062CD|nr:receptor-like protein EIX1 [Prosopis cineraria]